MKMPSGVRKALNRSAFCVSLMCWPQLLALDSAIYRINQQRIIIKEINYAIQWIQVYLAVSLLSNRRLSPDDYTPGQFGRSIS